MQGGAATAVHSEQEFAAIVDQLAVDPGRRHELLELLAEDHPLYDQRGAATVVRMRGWVLVALSRSTLTDAALLFVLEELDRRRRLPGSSRSRCGCGPGRVARVEGGWIIEAVVG